MFHIEIDKLYWVDRKEDNADDLCLHGDVKVQIGEETFKYSCTVSSTAIYLLKSLTENHMINEESNQMLPCCGHLMIANVSLDSVEIFGCPNGIDWSVIHENGKIKLITESGRETYADFDDYQNQVFRFADIVEDFYNNSLERVLSNHQFEINGYTALWNEWHRRRGLRA